MTTDVPKRGPMSIIADKLALRVGVGEAPGQRVASCPSPREGAGHCPATRELIVSNDNNNDNNDILITTIVSNNITYVKLYCNI